MEVLYPRCCGLDVHKETIVACLRPVIQSKIVKEARTFSTTTADLMNLSEWLAQNKCTHVAMEPDKPLMKQMARNVTIGGMRRPAALLLSPA